MLAGQSYNPNDPILTEERKKTRKQLIILNSHLEGISGNELLKIFPNVHTSLFIQPPFYCDYGYNIYCEENVFFNFNCVVLDVARVTIGKNVFFAPAVQIYTATHPLDYLERRTQESGRPVTIGDDCWIGGGAIILPGVKIGSRSVIGAGAVVTKDIPDDSLAVGNPAVVIKELK